MSYRNVDRLPLAAVLVVIVGISRGLDAAMVVALSLVAMGIGDAIRRPPGPERAAAGENDRSYHRAP